jgi:hypothetical protein
VTKHGVDGIRKRSVSWDCDGATDVSDQVPHRTTNGPNNS